MLSAPLEGELVEAGELGRRRRDELGGVGEAVDKDGPEDIHLAVDGGGLGVDGFEGASKALFIGGRLGGAGVVQVVLAPKVGEGAGLTKGDGGVVDLDGDGVSMGVAGTGTIVGEFICAEFVGG